jgi:hypothetical protein
MLNTYGRRSQALPIDEDDAVFQEGEDLRPALKEHRRSNEEVRMQHVYMIKAFKVLEWERTHHCSEIVQFGHCHQPSVEEDYRIGTECIRLKQNELLFLVQTFVDGLNEEQHALLKFLLLGVFVRQHRAEDKNCMAFLSVNTSVENRRIGKQFLAEFGVLRHLQPHLMSRLVLLKLGTQLRVGFAKCQEVVQLPISR